MVMGAGLAPALFPKWWQLYRLLSSLLDVIPCSLNLVTVTGFEPASHAFGAKAWNPTKFSKYGVKAINYFDKSALLNP